MQLFLFCVLCFFAGALFQVLVLKVVTPSIRDRQFNVATMFTATALLAAMLAIVFWIRTLFAGI